MITLTITGDSMEQVMKSLNGSFPTPAVGGPGPSVEKTPAPKTEKPKAQEKPAPGVETTSKPAAPDAPVAYTIEDVKAIVPKLVAKEGVGRDKVVALLGTYGAKKGSEVPVDKIADFMTKANALLAA